MTYKTKGWDQFEVGYFNKFGAEVPVYSPR
jgi:hypothetical protein